MNTDPNDVMPYDDAPPRPQIAIKRRYGRIQGLVLALFSGAFYRDVARNWRGIGFLYLMLLLILTWIPLLIKYQIGLSHFVRDEFPKVTKDLPTITIQDGNVSSPVPQPFIANDPKTGQPLFVLDTTGKIKSLNDTKAKMLLTKTHFHQRDQGRDQITDLRGFPNMTFSKEWLQGWAEFVEKWLFVCLFPFMLIGSLIRALIIVLLASLVGLVFNSTFNAGLRYGALFRLAVVGMTLSVYLDMAFQLAGLPVPMYFFLALAMTIGYVAFGVKMAGPRMEVAETAVYGREPLAWDVPPPSPPSQGPWLHEG